MVVSRGLPGPNFPPPRKRAAASSRWPTIRQPFSSPEPELRASTSFPGTQRSSRHVTKTSKACGQHQARWRPLSGRSRPQGEAAAPQSLGGPVPWREAAVSRVACIPRMGLRWSAWTSFWSAWTVFWPVFGQGLVHRTGVGDPRGEGSSLVWRPRPPCTPDFELARRPASPQPPNGGPSPARSTQVSSAKPPTRSPPGGGPTRRAQPRRSSFYR